jgi:hypothetical protein
MHELPSESVSGARTTHLMQLFDSDESLADAVAAFFAIGLMRRETILAVMDDIRWYSVAMRLSARGLPVDEALRVGHLIVRNSRETLNRFMRRDKPDRRLFAATVGTLVSELMRSGRPVRIYGEMVDVLAAQGEYRAANELEELWNELATHNDFTLFCGYSAANFGDPRSAGALRRICGSHSEVLSNPRDVLGSFLVRANRTG